MRAKIEEYLRFRFAELEANEFQPITRSLCCRLHGTMRAYHSLSNGEQNRYRRIVAQVGAGYWLPKSRILSPDDDAWRSKFLQSLPAPQNPAVGRQLAKAPDLRRVAKLCFEQFFGTKPRRSEGNPGDWVCEGVVHECTVCVELRYACTMTQLVYGVHAEGMMPYLFLTAEKLYGLGLGWWNQVYLEEVDQSFALLRDLISLVIRDHIAITQIIRENA